MMNEQDALNAFYETKALLKGHFLLRSGLHSDHFFQCALVLQHTREFVSRYELDGAWFDMPIPIGGECFCSRCLELLRARHLDPFDKRVQRRHKQALLISFLDRATRLVRQTRPG